MGFEIFPDAVDRLFRQIEAKDHVRKVTEAAADIARTETTPDKDGDHVRAIVTEYHENLDGSLTGELGSTSSTWHIIEFGSVNNPPYRSLTRAVEKAGTKFDPSTDRSTPQ